MKQIIWGCLAILVLTGGYPGHAQASIEAGVVLIISGRDQEEGTGFVRCLVGDQAFIVTAYHVVDDSVHCNLEFYGQGVSATVGKVIYANVENDMAIIAAQVPRGVDVEHFALDSGSLDRGTEVVMCGFPQGGGDWKTSRGTYEASKDGLLEVTAPSAYRGFSGGPVLVGGKVVGMVKETRTRGGQKRMAAVPASVLIEHLRSAVVCVENVRKVSLGSVHFSEKAQGRLEKWFPDADATDELESVGLEELGQQLKEDGMELTAASTAGTPSIDIQLVSVSRVKQGDGYQYSINLELNRVDGAADGEIFRGTSNVRQMEGEDYNLIVVKSCMKKSIRHAVDSMNSEEKE